MAKTTAPLLGFGARGQIGKTMVAASWKGVSYMREYVIPKNPQTSAQTLTRAIFTFLSGLWKASSSDFQAPWAAYAEGQPLTDRNALTKFNIPALRAGSDLTGFVGSPGAKGGLPVASLSVAAASDVITATIGAPTLPAGWTISKAVAVAIKDVDPHGNLDYTSVSGTDAVTPYAPTMAVAGAGTYLVSAWFVFQKPDMSLAYGPSSNSTVVVS